MKIANEVDIDSMNVDEDHAKIMEQNPHLKQCFVNQREFIRYDGPFTSSQRYVDCDNLNPRTPYRRRQGEVKTVESYPHRCRLLMEIEFLTMYANDSGVKNVVYAGAAPGDRISYLTTLFPDLKFFLISDGRFTCQQSGQIEILNERFDSDLASSFQDMGVLFICDINSSPSYAKFREKEARNRKDMEDQQDWHETMKPIASLLKFRLPYPTGNSTTEYTNYLAGQIRLPIYGGKTSTDALLIVDDIECRKVNYSWKEFEDLMFHHNTRTRETFYPHEIDDPFVDHCYDCRSEIYVIQSYLQQLHGNRLREDELNHLTIKMMAALSESCPKIERQKLK